MVWIGGHRGMGCTDHAFYAERRVLEALPVENTVESVRAAFAAGADFVEIDAVLLADGTVAVVHNVVPADHFFGADAPVQPLNRLGWAAVKDCASGRLGTGRLARLDEVLAAVAASDPGTAPYAVNIELKGVQRSAQGWDGHELAEAVAGVVKASGMAVERVLFSSFALANVVAMAGRLPAAQYGMLFYEKDGLEAIYSDDNGDWRLQALPFERVMAERVLEAFASAETGARLGWVHPEVETVDEAMVQWVAEKGLGLNTWGLLEAWDEPARARYARLLAMTGEVPVGVITDYVGEMRCLEGVE